MNLLSEENQGDHMVVVGKSQLRKTGMLVKALLRATPLASLADIPDDLREFSAPDEVSDFVELAASVVDKGNATIPSAERAGAMTVLQVMLTREDPQDLFGAAIEGTNRLEALFDTNAYHGLRNNAQLTQQGNDYLACLTKTTFQLVHEWLHSPAADHRAHSAALKSVLEILRRLEKQDVVIRRQLARLDEAFEGWCAASSDTSLEAVRGFLGELSSLRRLAFDSNEDVVGGFNERAKDLGVEPTTLEVIDETLSARIPTLPDWRSFVRPFVQTCLEGCEVPSSGAQRWGAVPGDESDWDIYYRVTAAGIALENTPILKPGFSSPKERKRLRKRVEFLKQERMASVLAGGGLTATLKTIYGKNLTEARQELVRLNDVEFPIVTFPAAPSKWAPGSAALEAAKGDLVPGRLPDESEFDPSWYPGAKSRFVECLERHRTGSRKLKRRFFSGPTFALEKITLRSDGPQVDARLSRYFSSIATSEDLDAELMRSLEANPNEAVGLDALPMRRWLHENVGDPILDGGRRAAALSHATVVLLSDGNGGFNLMLPFRSADVATHAHFNHIAPSGIFSPHYDTPNPLEREYSVQRNFFREWVEELYAQDAHEIPPFLPAPDPEGEPEAVRLKKVLESGDAELYYTGVSVNLMTLRPEFCLLLIIRDPNWFQNEREIAEQTGRPFRFGWEYSPDMTHVRRRSRTQPQSWLLPITSQLGLTEGCVVSADFLVPNAAGAIDLAMRALSRIA